jgi:UDP-glucose 4-epimerase
MSSRVLVTGGAGFIGSHLVDALVMAGEAVNVLDDLSTGEAHNLDSARATGNVKFVHGSVLDPAAVECAISGCDRVYHLAVQCVRRSLGDPNGSHAVNATGTLNVLEAARKARVARFIYCSSSEVYGNTSTGLLHEETTLCRPVTVYGAAKFAGELYTEAYRQTYGLPTQTVRPFNAYGPRAHVTGDLAEVIPRFVVRVLNGRPPIIFGTGSNGRDFTYVTEVAHGLILAGENPKAVGTRINIAYGQMVTIQNVAKAVMRVCGRNDLTAQTVSPRPGDVHVLRADTSRGTELLGYKAKIAFDEGLRRYLDWFRNHYPDPSVLFDEQIENWKLPFGSDSGTA